MKAFIRKKILILVPKHLAILGVAVLRLKKKLGIFVFIAIFTNKFENAHAQRRVEFSRTRTLALRDGCFLILGKRIFFP